MLDAMMLALTNPVALFRQLKNDDRLISRAFFVVLIILIPVTISGYFIAQNQQIFTGTIGSITFITTFLAVPIVFLIVWAVNGLIVRMSAGMNAKPWAVSAYALTPQLIISTLIVLTMVFFPTNLAPVTLEPTDPNFQVDVEKLSQELQAAPATRISQILSYVSSAWFLLITFFGIRELVGQDKALRTTVILAVFTLVLTVGPLLLQSAV